MADLIGYIKCFFGAHNALRIKDVDSEGNLLTHIICNRCPYRETKSD